MVLEVLLTTYLITPRSNAYVAPLALTVAESSFTAPTSSNLPVSVCASVCPNRVPAGPVRVSTYVNCVRALTTMLAPTGGTAVNSIT